jgi:hypothetical protein
LLFGGIRLLHLDRPDAKELFDGGRLFGGKE